MSPSPDPATTDWVPIWNLSSASAGANLTYKGSFIAGSYVDGDVVIGSDNIAYLCVTPTNAAPVPWTGIAGPTGPPGPQGPQGAAGIQGPAGTGIPTVQNGKWLNGSGGTAVWADLATYNTTLPGGPVDGQRAVLVDSVTNPSYQWEFRYNAQSTSAYKWEFVGGTPAYVALEVAEQLTATAMSDLATVGPSFVIPRSGDYLVKASVRVDKFTGLGWTCTYTIVAVNNIQVGPYLELFNINYNVGPGPCHYSNVSEEAKWTRTAGETLKLRHMIIEQDTAGQAVSISHRRLTVTPVRIS